MLFSSGLELLRKGRFSVAAMLTAALAAPASAQSVRFWLSYEDAAFAALNGKQVGQELDANSKVGSLNSIKVGINATGIDSGAYWNGGLMLAFDTVMTNGTSSYASLSAFNAATIDRVLTISSLSSPDIVFGSIYPGVKLNGTPTTVELFAQPPEMSGVAGTGTTLRPGGIWDRFQFGGSVRLALSQGTSVLLSTVKLKVNLSLLAVSGGVYGDGGLESGLTLFVAGATDRSTYLSPISGSGQGTSTKYQISTVVGEVPIANPDSYSVAEDGTLTVAAPGVLANDTDNTSTIVAAEVRAQPQHSSAFTMLANGGFTYKPAQNFAGTDYFTYAARNAANAFSGPATVTITVTPSNDPPVIQPPANASLKEMVAGTLQFTATDPLDDPDDTPITFALVSGPAGATMNSSGLLSWTPTEAQGPGTFQVTVRATDSGTPPASSSLTTNITVTESNQAPNLNAIPSQTIDELREATFTAAATDADLPAQPLQYGLRNSYPGMSINPATGVFKWIPSESQGPLVGLFYVTVSDGLTTSETPVSVTVKEINSAPVLQPINDILTVGDQVVEFDCRVKDDDIPNNAYVFFMEGAPAGATLSVFDGHFRWIPPVVTVSQNFDFKIKVIDNGVPNMTSEQNVRITVVPSGNLSPIEGKITLQDWKPTAEGQKVSFEVRSSLGAVLEIIPNVSLGAGGTYSVMSNQVGTVVLSVRGLTWLASSRYPVNLGPSVAKVGFSLLNGDVNGDNYIGTDDYLRLSAAFDTSMADPAFDDNADLNGDGYVGTDDYLILNKNFDQQGM